MTIPHMTASTEAAQWMAKIIGVDWAVFDRNTGQSRTFSRLPFCISQRVKLYAAISACWDWSSSEICRATNTPNHSTMFTAMKKHGITDGMKAVVRIETDEAYERASDELKNARPLPPPMPRPKVEPKPELVPEMIPRAVLVEMRAAKRKRERHGCDCKCSACVELTDLARRLLARNPDVRATMLEPMVRPFVRELQQRRAMGMTA